MALTHREEQKRTNYAHLAGIGCMVGVLTGVIGLDIMGALATATFVFVAMKALELP
jgi:hypothetical protein